MAIFQEKELAMAHYSVAKTRDNLSSLIDKALAGEEVVITRHGKPAVALSIVKDFGASHDVQMREQVEWLDKLKRRREALPRPSLSYMQIKQMDQADYEH
jgi:prevent-host-death family protein